MRSPLGVVALLAAGPALVGCTAAPASGDWSADVYYTDLSPGVCLSDSYDENGALQGDAFNENAAYFRAVGCGQPHRAQVVGVVDIPAATEWEDYGTGDGPSSDEGLDWAQAVCDAYGALVDRHRESGGTSEPLTVSLAVGLLGDPVLGACIAHRDDRAEYTDAIDIAELRALGDDGFGAELPSAAADWLADPLTTPVDTVWSTVDPFDCVDSYQDADRESYAVVACSVPHTAQMIGMVPMPDDWTGYRTDEEAAAVASARCGELQTALQAVRPELVVDTSSVSADFVFQGRYLAQCWARAADLSPWEGDLRSVLGPHPSTDAG